MKKFISMVTVLVSCNLFAAEQWTTLESSSRNGSIPIFSIDSDDATATVVLVPGGSFVIGNKAPDTGRPDGINFLVRTAGQFSSEKFNVVLMGKPEKGGDMRSISIRQSGHHGSDVMQVANFAKEFKKPVWLVGTSLGSISVANTALLDKRSVISGVVLSSAVYRTKQREGLLSMNLNDLKIPILISAHEKDECPDTNPAMIGELKGQLPSSKNVQVALIANGNAPTGNVCGPNHWHGFINAELETVQSVAQFIRAN